tara:strand:+ start:40260 stop:40940 length:681 start_codon:yes stop_codon:yes gene_type:complete
MKQTNSFFISDFDFFMLNYRDFKQAKSVDSLESCIKQINSCFDIWANDFLKINFNNNINIVTLFSLLSKDDKPKASFAWKLDTYKRYLKDNSLTFKDHLIEAFLMHMYKETILYDNYPKRYKFLFYISQEIKYSLFKIIRRILQQFKRDFFTNPVDLFFSTQFTLNSDLSLELYFLFLRNKLLYSIIISLLHENDTWKNIKLKYKLNNSDYILLKEEANSWIDTVL